MSRDVTKEQFAEDIIISGRRIGRAVDSVITTVNEMPRGFLKEKWTESRIVRNWSPPIGGTYMNHWPFLRAHNGVNDIYFTGGGEADDISNPHREKGYTTFGIPDTPLDDPTTEARHYIWSETFQFSNPVILIDWALLMLVEGAGSGGSGNYENNWIYGRDDTTPDGQGEHDPRRDVTMILSVDSDLDIEDRSLSDVVAIQHGFSTRESKVSEVAWTAPGAGPDYPNTYPQGAPAGFYRRQRLNIPLRPGSRLRMSVIIPFYKDPVGDHDGWWHTVFSEAPWWNQCWNQTLHFLEPLENGQD